MPAGEAAGYSWVIFDVDAGARALYRYLDLDLSGTASLHVWLRWKSSGTYLTYAPLSTAAPAVYGSGVRVDLQREAPAAADETMQVCLVVLGTRCGVNAAGEVLNVNGIALHQDAESAAPYCRLLPTVSSTPNASNDGGYYVAAADFAAEDYGQRGVKLFNNSTSTYVNVIWALPAAQIAQHPYLVFDVNQADSTQQQIHLMLYDTNATTGVKNYYYWTQVSTITDPQIIDIYDLLGTTSPNQYVYFEIYLLGNNNGSALALNSFYLTANADGSVGLPAARAAHRVTFHTDGGSAEPIQLVYDGDAADAVAVPTKPGYTFAGWYADAARTVPFYFSAAIHADTTLYAKWAVDGISRAYAQISALPFSDQIAAPYPQGSAPFGSRAARSS